jgi:hypothetical protein
MADAKKITRRRLSTELKARVLEERAAGCVGGVSGDGAR